MIGNSRFRVVEVDFVGFDEKLVDFSSLHTKLFRPTWQTVLKQPKAHKLVAALLAGIHLACDDRELGPESLIKEEK